MWLILTESHDSSGAWLADGMRERTVQPVLHLHSRDIGPGAECERGMSRDGPWFRLRTERGDVVDSRTLRGVVNRVRALPPGLVQRMSLPDREQVIANFSSPLLRLFRDLPCPVLNRTTAQGLSGDFRIDGEWSALADSAGFLSAPLASTPTVFRSPGRAAPLAELTNVSRVVVIGERVVPLDAATRSVPPALAAKCLKVANAARATFLGIDAVRLFPRDWRFVAANFCPDLRQGESALLDAIAEYLEGPVGETSSEPGGTAASAVEEKRSSVRFRDLLHLW